MLCVITVVRDNFLALETEIHSKK